MKNILILTIFLLMIIPSVKAQESQGDDQDFMNLLDKIKSPFEDGIPKPAPVVQKPVVAEEQPVDVAPPPAPPPPPPQIVHEMIVLPSDLTLDGIIVGEGIHEAIMSGQIVTPGRVIEGVRIVSITKEQVVGLYKGKKFFFKVD